MRFDNFRTDDIPVFLRLAATENWVSAPWEFDFLLSRFPQGCFAARGNSGEYAGFVTSLRHERSGWIGNLIVEGTYRGQGIGESLFVSALEVLRADGVETVWLTASKSGQALYEKHGFRSVDTMVRWVGTGRHRHAGASSPGDMADLNSTIAGFDSRAWGDRRDSLLAATVGRGELLIEEAGFAVIQPCGGASQLGPFNALDSGTAERILDEALRKIQPASLLYLDSPASNRAALRLFNRRKLKISGTNLLMYAGVRPEYRPELLYGLATMGSCG
jgi:ribosomal protein S18 acetylase RimI-like enzyme